MIALSAIFAFLAFLMAFTTLYTYRYKITPGSFFWPSAWATGLFAAISGVLWLWA